MPVSTPDKTPGVTVERLGESQDPQTPSGVPLAQAWEAYVKAGESGNSVQNAILRAMYEEIMSIKAAGKKK